MQKVNTKIELQYQFKWIILGDGGGWDQTKASGRC